MKGVEECLCLLGVTMTALLHHQSPESGLIDARDRVRGMTIFAGGILLLGVRVIRPVDAGAELFFYPMVADATGAGDVLRIDQRARVIRRQFRVCAVTISTRRCHDETVGQSPAMYAVFIAADDVRHISLDPFRRLLTDAMTATAQLGYVACISGRGG